MKVIYNWKLSPGCRVSMIPYSGHVKGESPVEKQVPNLYVYLIPDPGKPAKDRKHGHSKKRRINELKYLLLTSC